MDMYQLNQIPSETQIRKFLRRILFGKNVFCPKCRCRQIHKNHDRYWCPKCRRRFSLLSYTWLHDLKLPLQRWWLVLWCWTNQISIQQAIKLTHLSELAIRHWYDNFRAHLPENPHILSRIVQLDEAYGKGWSLVMAKQKNSRKVAFVVLPEKSVERQQAVKFLSQYVKPRSRLYTDGAAIYKGIERWWPVKHEKDLHAKWEFGRTSEIEGLFGNFRTFIRRMYHHVTPEKMPEYAREFSARFSSPEMFTSPNDYLAKTLIFAPID
jgi:transposase-like protein